jgi:hypothetical protein
MSGPGWLAGGLAWLMIAIAVCCAGRLAVSRLHGRPAERDADGLHVLMGVAMAGMLAPRLSAVPAAAWSAVFAAGPRAVVTVPATAGILGQPAPASPAHGHQLALAPRAAVYYKIAMGLTMGYMLVMML